jgi:hypothetical protein
VTAARFFRVTRTAAMALAIVIPGIVLSAGTAGTAEAASPDPQVCFPAVGTTISSKAISNASAWSPTNVSSEFLAGPAEIERTITKTSLTGQTISASFTLDEGLLFASAHETYGIMLQRQHSQAGAWTYILDVPAGKTLRAQQYHQSWEVGVKQVYMGLTRAKRCHEYTEYSRSGDFFPDRHGDNVDFCWSTTPSKRSPIQVAYTCHNVK